MFKVTGTRKRQRRAAVLSPNMTWDQEYEQANCRCVFGVRSEGMGFTLPLHRLLFGDSERKGTSYDRTTLVPSHGTAA